MQNTENTEMDGKQACTKKVYRVEEKDLPLSCPPRDLRVWDAHPRVYMPIEELGEVRCPYCSAHYILEKSAK
jgi:uncharacterized Zn-finger protein